MSKSEAAIAVAAPLARPRRWTPPSPAALVPWAVVGALIALWELGVATGAIDPFFFGRPSEIGAFLASGVVDGSLFGHAAITLWAQMLGLALGTVVGTAIGLGLWWSPFLAKVLEPYAVVLNATPKIVIAPLLVVWFGLGLMSKIMIAALICVIVAWLGAFEGMRRVDPDQVDLMRSLGAKRPRIFRAVVLPSAMPDIFATLRLNVGFALIGVVTGEFLSSTAGLGYLVDSTAKNYQMSHTLGAIVVIGALAAVQLRLAALAERRLVRWGDHDAVGIGG